MIEKAAYRSIDRCFSLFSSSAALVSQGCFLSLFLPPLSASVDLSTCKRNRSKHSLCPLPGVVRLGRHLVRRHRKRRGARGRPLHRRRRCTSSSSTSSVHEHRVRRRGRQGQRRAGAPGPQRLGVRKGLGVHVLCEEKERPRERFQWPPEFFFFEVRRREQATLKKQISALRT